MKERGHGGRREVQDVSFSLTLFCNINPPPPPPAGAQSVSQSVSWPGLAGWSVHHTAGSETDLRSMLSVAAVSWGGSPSPWWQLTDALSWCPQRNIQEASGSERTCWLMGNSSLWRRPEERRQPIRFTQQNHAHQKDPLRSRRRRHNRRNTKGSFMLYIRYGHGRSHLSVLYSLYSLREHKWTFRGASD